MEGIHIEKLAFVVQTTDGETRHLITKKENISAILAFIDSIEGGLKVTNPINDIKFLTDEDNE